MKRSTRRRDSITLEIMPTKFSESPEEKEKEE